MVTDVQVTPSDAVTVPASTQILNAMAKRIAKTIQMKHLQNVPEDQLRRNASEYSFFANVHLNSLRDFQFRCETGECISEDFVCDGKADCSDRSDETQNICSSLHCPEYNFRCSYGACVNSEAKCNGKIDCVDGSDESPAACNTTPAVTPIIDVTPSVTDAAVG